ncbi:hypothetical protein [Metallosphaera sedula]|uniref:hypothetical protein n=1 Tax=Metallosphaera sedula TaxID=43687 RepID=UPI0020BE7F56|nr:hypothetical protein [Metallosphaera sedula]
MCNLEFGGVLYASLPSQIDGNWEVTVFSEVNGKILRVNIEKSKWGKIRIRSKLFNIVIRIEDLEDPQLKNKVMSHIINELASLFDEGKKQ